MIARPRRRTRLSAASGQQPLLHPSEEPLDPLASVLYYGHPMKVTHKFCWNAS